MSQPAEKVHTMEEYKSTEEPKQEEVAAAVMDKANKDMGKVAIFISLLSVLLLVVFFFGLNQNIAGLSKEVQNLSGVRDEVAALDGRVGAVQGAVGGVERTVTVMEGRVTELEKLPAQTRNMIIVNDLSAMSEKMGYIGGQLTPAQSAKLKEAQQLVKDLQSQLSN